MAGRTTAKTELFSHWMGGALVIADEGMSTGGRLWVSSVIGSDSTGYGLAPDKPCATLDYADTLCTGNAYDIIYLMPGHTETIASAAASPTISKIGVKVIGLGNGDDRPTFTFTHVDANIIVAATNQWYENILFVAGIDNVVEMLDINFCDCTVKDCEFRGDTNFQATTSIDINGGGANAADRPHILHCKFQSMAAGAVNAVEIGAVEDGVWIEDNWVSGDFSDAGIWSDQILTNANISRNYVRNTNAGDWAIELSGAATGVCNDNRLMSDAVGTALDPGSLMCNGNLWVGAIDQAGVPIPVAAAGALPAGSIDAAALANGAIDLATLSYDVGEVSTDGIVITRATGALPQTAAAAIFTVTGHCLLKRIMGVVTANIGGVGNVTHLRLNSTGVGATTDLCLAAGGLDVTGDVADTTYTITGVFGAAMVATTNLPIATVAYEITLVPGSIEVACAGSDGGGGRVRWSVVYVPLEAGARIVAA